MWTRKDLRTLIQQYAWLLFSIFVALIGALNVLLWLECQQRVIHQKIMSQRLSPVCQKCLARRSFLTRLSCLNRGIVEVPFKQIQHASLVFLLCQSCLKKFPRLIVLLVESHQTSKMMLFFEIILCCLKLGSPQVHRFIIIPSTKKRQFIHCLLTLRHNWDSDSISWGFSPRTPIYGHPLGRRRNAQKSWG